MHWRHTAAAALLCCSISPLPACGEKDHGSTAAVPDDGGEGTSVNDQCWEQQTRSDCDALGDACQFEAGNGRRLYAAGVCVEDTEETFGWCVPAGEFGGSAIGSVWYQPSTGRVISFGLWVTVSPPGWEGCPVDDALAQDFCPSPIEACQACLCDGAQSESST